MNTSSIESIILCCILGMAVLWISGCAVTSPTDLNRAEFLRLFEKEMLINTAWARVHAAEALVEHGARTQAVVQCFAAMEAREKAPLRIGVWRVLARTSAVPPHQSIYLQKIKRVAMDPNSPDRLSAVESLAKLNYVPSVAERELLKVWSTSSRDATNAFVFWLLALSTQGAERAACESRLAQILSSPDPIARLRASFAIGRLKEPGPDTLQNLLGCVPNEPEESPAKAYMLSAAWSHGTDRFTPEWKQMLIYHMLHGKASEQLETAVAVGRYGNQQDVTLLTQMLGHAEPDARIGALSGLLFADSRSITLSTERKATE